MSIPAIPETAVLHLSGNTQVLGTCRHVHEQLTRAVQQAMQQYQGNECLLLIIEALQQEATRVLEDAHQHAIEKSKSSQESLELSQLPSQIGRRSIW